MVVVRCGSCADLGDRVRKHAKAVLHGWYPGALGGLAIANTIAGKSNPSGKLPITFYRDDDAIPPMENYDMEGRTYRYLKTEPLYPFGYGLSYTNFAFENAAVVSADGQAFNCEIDVQNTGTRAGRAVVQCYAKFTDSRTTTPNCQLCGVSSVILQPGEIRRVQLRVEKFWLKAVLADGSRIDPDSGVTLFFGDGQPSEASVSLRVE